jgi:heme exporter protein A
MLSCQGLTLLHPDSNAILFSELSFSMMPSSGLYIIGPNGIGKTSLLRCLAGLQKTFKGKITFQGQDLAQAPLSLINYIGHNLGLTLELTVMEHLNYWAKSFASISAIWAAIYYLNLQEFLKVPIFKLSCGNRKKVAIARLLFGNSLIWLLDEIQTNLDEQNSKILHTIISSKISSGGFVLIASHQKPIKENMPILNLADYS